MSGEFNSRKDLHPRKFEQNLSFRELCDSKLPGLHDFDTMDIDSKKS